jgi:predicted permease
MFASLRKLTRRRRLEREMAEELAHHLQVRAEDLVRAGASPAEALRQARVEFGGVERYKEDLRDTRHFGLIEDFARDVRIACRNFRRSPLFALSAAGAIALGIAVNVAIFSLVYGGLFRPLPVRDPAGVRIVYVSMSGEGPRTAHGSRYFVSYSEFTFLREHSQTADLGGISEAGVTTPFAPSGLHAQLVSDNLLPLLAPLPALGRYLAAGETTTIVLSYDAWQKYFHGENIIGRLVTLNRTAFTIAGVAPRNFAGPLVLKADVWIPIAMQPITRAGEPLINDPNAGWIQVMGRRRPGVSDSAMRAEMQVLAQQAVAAHSPAKRAAVILSPGALFNLPEVMRVTVPALGILFSIVSLVLLAACANVANMLIARGFSRAREIGIRLSIGAGKARLIRQLLTEHILLGLLGGAGGFVLSQFAAQTLLRLTPSPGGIQIDVSPDWRIAAWTFLIALASGAVFGLPSALGMLRGDLTQSLRGDAFEAGAKRRGARLQNALIATQVAVSALLLITASLLLRAATRAIRLDPGQATTGVLIAKPNLRDLQYTPAQAGVYLDTLRARAAALPGVQAAALTGFEPILTTCGSVVLTKDSGDLGVECAEVGPDFLRVMGIRLLQGRAIEEADRRAGAKVALVDENFARRYLPGNPLGRRLRLIGETTDHEVVGVVVATRPLLFLKESRPLIYTPLSGLRNLEGRLVIAYEGPRAPLIAALRGAGAQLDKDTSMTITPIEDDVAMALSFVRLAATGVAALGGLALVLACTGVYGVVAFAVGRRRREIGVRIALGARPASVMRLLIRQSLRPIATGAAIGAALAAGGSQVIRAALYGISPLDPAGWAAALALLAAVAIAAAILPASSALRVDPAKTLRHD